jgi:hypothetical protein
MSYLFGVVCFAVVAAIAVGLALHRAARSVDCILAELPTRGGAEVPAQRRPVEDGAGIGPSAPPAVDVPGSPAAPPRRREVVA